MAWLALLVFFTPVAVMADKPESYLAKQYEVDIPAQSLADALNMLSEQTQLLLLFPYQVATNIESRAVKGTYSLSRIMELMLEGTGFTGGLTKKRVLTISLTKSADTTNHGENTGEDMNKNKSRLSSIFGSFLAALGAGEVAADTAGEQVKSGVIEEVIVTAERKQANLQDAPIAITAFTSTDIERSQLFDARDLARMTPSLTFNQALAGSQIYIRGVGQGNPVPGNSPGVAMYLDGVYLGHPFTNNAAFYDAERFEILRGPQGTLYGRNSTGGSINVITRSPTMEPDLKTTVGVGDYDRMWLLASANAPVVDGKLAVRGSLALEQRDGYVKNRTTGADVDDRDLESYWLSALYTPTDNLEILLKGDYQNDQRLERPVSFIRSVPGSGLDPTLFGAQTSLDDSSEVFNERDRERETTFKGLNATVTWRLGDLTLKSITGYRDSENLTDFGDNDGTSLPFVSIESSVETEEFFQEFTLAGTAFDGRLDWVSGVNYYDDEVENLAHSILPFLTTLLPPLPDTPRIDGGALSGASVALSFEEELTSTGVFFQGTWSATDQLRLTAGARYTEDEKDKLHTVRSNVTAPSSHCEGLRTSKNWDATTWKLGADYDFSDDTMIYGSVSTGFKAGGFNSGACDDDYDDESITAYEIGTKSTLLNQRLRLNSSLFFYDYTDQQVRAFQDAVLQIANAGESELWGAELEFLFKPTANLQFDGGVAYLDAEYTDAELDDPMIPGIAPVQVKGNRMERAPEWKANLNAQYTLGDFDLRYELAYSDSIYTDSFENEFNEIDAYTTHNARLIWRPNSMPTLSAQLFVENFTDESYEDYLVASSFWGGVVASYGPPRTWGLLVTWNP